jgi:hypothetical protein
MDINNVEALLSYHCLIGEYIYVITYMYLCYSFAISFRFLTRCCIVCLSAPLDPNPVSEIDKIVNELRIKYSTYVVEFNVEHVGYHYFIFPVFLFLSIICFTLY